MKRLAIVGVAMLFTVWAGPAVGQGIGAHAGLTWATATGDDVEDAADYKTDLSFGAYLTFDLMPTLSIRPELNYMAFGADVSDVDITATLDIRYVQIPVLLQLSLPTPGARPYLFAGPAVSFEAKCTAEAESGGISASADCDDADLFERKSTMWSLIGGAGLGFGIGPGEASIGVRYDMGLTSLDDSVDEADIRSQAISVLIGFSLGLGM